MLLKAGIFPGVKMKTLESESEVVCFLSCPSGFHCLIRFTATVEASRLNSRL